MGQKGKAPHQKLIPLKSNLKFNKSYDLIIAVEPQGRGGSARRAEGRHRGGESSSQGWLSLLKGSPSLPGHAGYCLATSWLPPGYLLACPKHSVLPPASSLPALSSSVRTAGSGSGVTAAGEDGEHHGGAPPNNASIYEINASTCPPGCRGVLHHPRTRCRFSEGCWHGQSHRSAPAWLLQQPHIHPPKDESHLPSESWDCSRLRGIPVGSAHPRTSRR